MTGPELLGLLNEMNPSIRAELADDLLLAISDHDQCPRNLAGKARAQKQPLADGDTTLRVNAIIKLM